MGEQSLDSRYRDSTRENELKSERRLGSTSWLEDRLKKKDGKSRERDESRRDYKDSDKLDERNERDKRDEERRDRNDDREKERYEYEKRKEYERYKQDDDKERNRDDRDRHQEKREEREDDKRNERRDETRKNDLSNILAPASTVLSLDDVLKGKEIKSKESYVQPKSAPVQTQPNMPPSLAQIASGSVQMGADGTRDMTHITKNEEAESTKRKDLLFKFKILKRLYKEATIPEFSDYTDIKTLEKEYDSIVRQLSLDATVENYRKYLIIGFGILEFVLGSIFKMEDIKGFAKQQLLGMNQYERILYEIGEKRTLDYLNKWSPEIRLLGIILVNGAVFVGTKMLFRATGSDIMNMINPVTQPQVQTNQSSNSRPRMRGPELNLTDLSNKKSS